MSTLAVDTPRSFEAGFENWINEIPIIASDTVFQGAAVGESASTGTGRPLVAGDNFLGFAEDQCANEGGAASAKRIKLRELGLVKLTVTGASSAANNGDDVYASDDATFTLTATSNSPIGKVHRWVTSTTCWVFFRSYLVDTNTPLVSSGTGGTVKIGPVADAELASIKGIYDSGTIAVTVPSITDPDCAKVDVSIATMTFAAAVGDAVIAIPLEALPTNCRLGGAWVSGTDTVTITFSSEGGNVTGAAKNFKFLITDLT